METTLHQSYMLLALEQARKAYELGEVPIGAIVVDPQGTVIGAGFNEVETKKTQTAHAEMAAILHASQNLDNWRLTDCTLYVSLEPCAMCMGLILLSRIKCLVYGAPSPKFGYHLDNCIALNLYQKNLEIVSDICSEEAAALLQEFFQKRREGREERDKRTKS